MEVKLLELYRKKILPNIEHPIREIVNSIWELPFVVDTNEACCGHIITNDYERSLASYDPIRRGLYWYPHGICLGVDFAEEEGLKEKAAEWGKDLVAVGKDIGVRVWESLRDYHIREGERRKVLHMRYDSEFPPRAFIPPVTGIEEYIEGAHERLIRFWEAVAEIQRRYNPDTKIEPINGRDFLQIIDWADLGDPERYRSKR